jgi:hypothetical protein
MSLTEEDMLVTFMNLKADGRRGAPHHHRVLPAGTTTCSSTGTLESLAWPPAEKDLVRCRYTRELLAICLCSASFVLNTIVFVCILRATTMLRSTPLQRWKYGIDQFGFAYNMSLPTSFYWTEGSSYFDLLN